MIIDMENFQLDSDKMMDAFSALFKNLGIDETDDQQVYNTVTVFMAYLFADGLFEACGNNPEKLESNLKQIGSEVAADIQEKIKAFLDVMQNDD